MKRKILYAAIFLIFISSGTFLRAAALDEGAYIVSNTTYYVNPDTGDADDGGDTSTGEGMCRNATYADSLYELDGGLHYVTLRIKLISFISDIHFFVQQTKGDPESYNEVSYTVTGSNDEENTKDFRFRLPADDVLIRPQFFVGPMDRDVTYFVGLDMETAKPDEGVFASYNGAVEETPAAASQTPAEETSEPSASPPETPAPQQSAAPSETPAPTPSAAAPETSAPSAAPTPDETVQSETDGAGDAESDDMPAAVSPGKTAAPSPAGAEADEEAPGTESAEVEGLIGFTAEGGAMTMEEPEDEDAAGEGAGGITGWVIAAALAAAVIIVVIAVGRYRWKKR